MSQWHFVLAAYGAVVMGTALLIALSWHAMRRAEAAAEALRTR